MSPMFGDVFWNLILAWGRKRDGKKLRSWRMPHCCTGHMLRQQMDASDEMSRDKERLDLLKTKGQWEVQILMLWCQLCFVVMVADPLDRPKGRLHAATRLQLNYVICITVLTGWMWEDVLEDGHSLARLALTIASLKLSVFEFVPWHAVLLYPSTNYLSYIRSIFSPKYFSSFNLHLTLSLPLGWGSAIQACQQGLQWTLALQLLNLATRSGAAFDAIGMSSTVVACDLAKSELHLFTLQESFTGGILIGNQNRVNFECIYKLNIISI